MLCSTDEKLKPTCACNNREGQGGKGQTIACSGSNAHANMLLKQRKTTMGWRRQTSVCSRQRLMSGLGGTTTVSAVVLRVGRNNRNNNNNNNNNHLFFLISKKEWNMQNSKTLRSPPSLSFYNCSLQAAANSTGQRNSQKTCSKPAKRNRMCKTKTPAKIEQKG